MFLDIKASVWLTSCFYFCLQFFALISTNWHFYFQRFYRHLELKSKHPDAAVPPLDETLKKITEPDWELVSQNKQVVDEFRRCFELKENPKVFLWNCKYIILFYVVALVRN